jgi:hypothetical protein
MAGPLTGSMLFTHPTKCTPNTLTHPPTHPPPTHPPTHPSPADFTELLRPRYRRPLAVGMSLMLFQQITGQPSVLYYAGGQGGCSWAGC